MIISPIIAAVLLKYWSPERILWIDLLTFVVAVVSLLVIRKFPIQDLQTERQQPAWRQHLSLLAEGFRFVYERKGLRMLLLLFLIINVGCAIQPVLPLFVTRVLMKGAEAFAQLELVFGLGLIIGNIGMTVIGRIRNQVLAIVGGLVVGGVLELTIGLQQELWMTVLIAFLFGIVLPVINASSTAIWLESVPNALQGRVFSIRASVAQTGIPIGYLLNGYLSDLYGSSFVFVVGGLLLILISILALGSDSFRNLNQRSATKIYNAKEN